MALYCTACIAAASVSLFVHCSFHGRGFLSGAQTILSHRACNVQVWKLGSHALPRTRHGGCVLVVLLERVCLGAPCFVLSLRRQRSGA